MRVGIVSVGAELLLGDLSDTNATWLAKRLAEVGAEVRWELCIGDDVADLVEGLGWLVERCDAVVVGGGLGPTPDDLTRESIAELAGLPMERLPELEERLEAFFVSRGLRMPEANRKQAAVPKGAVPIDPVGTAPGFAVEIARGDGRVCVVYALPGVPWEMRAMAESDVLPDLLRRGGRAAIVTRVVRVTGMGESAVAERLLPLLERVAGEDDVVLAFLAGRSEVRVRVTVRAPDPATARMRSVPFVDEVAHLVGPAVAGIDDEGLGDALGRLLRDAGLTVAVAESCTAGAVAALLAEPPGASDYLRGGFVVYATETKTDVLGVPAALLDEYGPVSEAVAEAMARAACERLAADVGIAVTCVAGPDTHGGEPVGTVVWALAVRGGPVRSHRLDVRGDRDAVRGRAAAAVLEGLRRWLTDAAGA